MIGNAFMGLSELSVMFLLDVVNMLIVLHAGTPPVVSQTVLNIMLVVLGIVVVGIGFGFLMKEKMGLRQHRWILTVSAVLALAAIFLVMLPTAFRFYTDPDVEMFSSMSIYTIIHGIVGAPAILTAVIYVFGDLPTKTRKWMRITAFLWVGSTLLGVILFLQMMELI